MWAAIVTASRNYGCILDKKICLEIQFLAYFIRAYIMSFENERNAFFIFNIKSGTTSYSSNWNVVILSYCRWPGMNYSNVRMDSSDGLNFFLVLTRSFIERICICVLCLFIILTYENKEEISWRKELSDP